MDERFVLGESGTSDSCDGLVLTLRDKTGARQQEEELLRPFGRIKLLAARPHPS